MAGFVNSKAASAIICAAILFSACSCQTKTGSSGEMPNATLIPLKVAEGMRFDEDRAQLDLAELALSPHPFGSERQKQLAGWIKDRAIQEGGKVVMEEFTAEVPNPVAKDPSAPAPLTLTRTGYNIYAFSNLTAAPECLILVGSHYDTKIVETTNYLGANDSGSSSLALLQMLRALRTHASEKDFSPPRCDIAMIWFDGEEATLENWNDGQLHPAKVNDNTYGSRHAVSRYTDCTFYSQKAKCAPAELTGKPVVALVLLDMIGSPDVVLLREANSTPALIDLAVRISDKLGMINLFETDPRGVEDDHIPYIGAGIPAVDLIDFQHLDYWHKAGDYPVRVSIQSIEKVAKTALATALTLAREPETAGK